MLRVLPLFKEDLYGNALHNLDIVAGGILRRKEAVARPAGAGDAVDVPVVLSAVRIYEDLYVLAGAHIGHLRLFEVGGYPNVLAVQRDNGHELLARRHILAGLDGPLSDDAVDRRHNRSVLEVELSLLQDCRRALRLRLRSFRTGALNGNLLGASQRVLQLCLRLG